jgi:hypothetical protein
VGSGVTAAGRRGRLARAAAAFAAAFLVLASAGAAEAQLPVGEADGVRVVRERGAIVVVFTERAAGLYRRIAGKRVSVLCWEFTEDGVNGGGAPLRAPKRRRPLRTGDLTRGMDYCRVWLEARTVRRNGRRLRRSREVIVSIPLTQRGAVFLDEQEKALSLQGLLLVVGLEERNADNWPTAAQLLASRIGRRLGSRLVALENPTDTPATGTVGYYSDGEQHVVVATVSASGRRLFIEYEADGVLRTNVAGYIYGDFF